jgi:methylated-DNA-[protein]-cysteine S-methyltransferase
MSPPVSAFQRRVHDALSRIPRGQVTTYRDLAAHLGCGSARAVGQALRRNPFAPDVPCHRVIRADLTPGGYQGAESGAAWHRKLELLREEGVLFRSHGGRLRLVDPDRLHRFPGSA